MKIIGIIPARFASTRFPAKPLADIAGKTMIQRVYMQALGSSTFLKVLVATDDEKIFDHVRQFGGEACMTSADHVSGTDRCYEALALQKETYDYAINIQGDEPFISPLQISQLASVLGGETQIATLIKKINDEEQLFNTNIVKVVADLSGHAMYFSRSPIPHVRNAEATHWLSKSAFYKHIGMYAYRTDVLKAITQLKPSALEKAESLEQLRWLENGFKIKVAETEIETIGVDTPEDLEVAIAFARKR
jgi:3-deoxy-manno-octulosonate cytidylyltransferase (CMP-KDO synthetase)